MAAHEYGEVTREWVLAVDAALAGQGQRIDALWDALAQTAKRVSELEAQIERYHEIDHARMDRRHALEVVVALLGENTPASIVVQYARTVMEFLDDG